MWTAQNCAAFVSLLRIPLGIAFLILFRKDNTGLLWICLAIALIAQISDHLDGWIVRRFSRPSLNGWIADSFSDRAFYLAFALAFHREYYLNDIVLWLFIMREILYYAFRVTSGDFSGRYRYARSIILWHAGIIRIGILCALVGSIAQIFDAKYLYVIENMVFIASSIIGYYMILKVAVAKS